MDVYLPKRKPVADLIEQPQMSAIEINIDRVDLKTSSFIDMEDLVLWIQIMDLPSIELSPYQNESSKLLSSKDSIHDNTGTNPLKTRMRSRFSIRKEKVSSRLFKYKQMTTAMINPAENGNADTNNDNEQNASIEQTNDDVESSVKQTNDDVGSSVKQTNDDVESNVNAVTNITQTNDDAVTNNTLTNDDVVSGVQQTNDGAELDVKHVSGNVNFPVTSEEESTNKFNNDDKDNESLKKIKFLTMLLDDVPIEAPEGMAFHSQCCVLVPSSSLSDLLYRMQRYPIVIYVILLERSCSKLIGKSIFKFDYKFLDTAVKAAKLKAAQISHGAEQSLPVYCSRANSKQVKIGSLISSINLICYGRFGMTEIVSEGDLMSAAYKEWQCNPYNSIGLPDNIDIKQQPYGFEPVITCNELPAAHAFECVSSPNRASVLEFVPTFFKQNPKECVNKKY